MSLAMSAFSSISKLLGAASAVKTREINAYEKAFARSEARIQEGALEAALASVRRLMKVVTKSPDADMEFIPCREIDGLLAQIGSAWRAQRADPEPSAAQQPEPSLDVLILTSFVWDVGGHTREIEDWVRGLRGLGQRTAVVTSLPRQASRHSIRNALAERVDFHDHTEATHLGALAWLVETIERLNPHVVIVSPETLDVSLFAALSILEFQGDLILNLTLDHNLSPGLFLSRVDHVLAKRPYLYDLLANEYKRENLIYIPFARSPSVDAARVETRAPRPRGAPLVTFSCTSTRYKIENDYAYRYVDVMVEVLTRTDTRHIHLGDISDAAKEEIVSRLSAAGVAAERFRHIPFAPRLGDVLVDEQVDVLIQTFPVGGGLVVIEAMEAGLVVVNHRCYNTKLFNASDFCYPGAPIWSKTDELIELLSSLDEAALERHHTLSRDYYRRCSQPGAIERMLATRDYSGVPVDEVQTRALYDYPLELGRVLGNRPAAIPGRSLFARLLDATRSRFS